MVLKVAAMGKRDGFRGIKIQITNSPKGLKRGIIWVKALAAPWRLIRAVMDKTMNWRTFEKEYEKHLLSSEVTLELMYFIKRLSLVEDVYLLGDVHLMGGDINKSEHKTLAKIIEKLALRSKTGGERARKYLDKRKKAKLCSNFSRKCHSSKKYKACDNPMKGTEACLSMLKKRR